MVRTKQPDVAAGALPAAALAARRVWRMLPSACVGPALTLAEIFVLRQLALTPYRFYAPFPVSILVVTVIYSVFRGGVLSGLGSAALTAGYLGYYLEFTTREFALDPAQGWNRLISWSIALPLIVAMVGELKRRSLRGVQVTERQAGAAQVAGYRQRTQIIFEHVSAVIWAIDAQGVFTFSEGSPLQALGLRSGERVGHSIFEFYPRESPLGQGVQLALAGKPGKVVVQVKAMWFEVIFSPTHDPHGRVDGVVGISVDVTSRLESESAKAQLRVVEESARLARESEAKFRGAFENSPIAIGLAQADGRWFDVNPAFCDMTGYPRAELLARSASEFIPRDESSPAEPSGDLAPSIRRILRCESGQISFERVFAHRDGHEVSLWINGSVIRDARGDPRYLLIQIVDVTERRLAERELRETTRQLQTLVNSSPVAILALDPRGQVTLWNPACERVFGWTAAEVLGGPLPFVPEARRAESRQIIERIMRIGGAGGAAGAGGATEAVHFEADRIRRDGSAMKTSTSAMPLLDEQKRVTGLMAVMMDHTERFHAQAELVETNRALQAAMRAKTDFLANMSHEIRTPINGVIGMTGLLLDMDLGAEQRGYAETIRNSAEILLRLVNDILDFSKIEAEKLELERIDFDLEQVIHNIELLLSVSAHKKGLRLLRQVSPDLPTAWCQGDPTRIGQILANLLGNAIKFTEQGQVVVELREEPPPPGTAADPGLIHLRFEVSDTGIGLSAAAITRMFQPFSQADVSTSRRFGGTGLGLSICKRLVELMGGQIGVRSREGEGSTFWFTICLRRGVQVVGTAAPAQISAPPDARHLRILLAEDNSVNQFIAVKMLEKHGFRVDAVANGNEAIEALQSVPYDLVLMDCQMPELDGYEACRRIRKMADPKLAGMPIIAMTANALPGDRERCLDAGMTHYVTKPIKAQDLVAAIYQVLGEAAAA